MSKKKTRFCFPKFHIFFSRSSSNHHRHPSRFARCTGVHKRTNQKQKKISIFPTLLLIHKICSIKIFLIREFKKQALLFEVRNILLRKTLETNNNCNNTTTQQTLRIVFDCISFIQTNSKAIAVWCVAVDFD